MQDVGNNGFIHSVSSLQHALGQICHRATIAELQWGVGGGGGGPQRKEDNEQKLTVSQHTLCLYNVSNSGKDMPNFHVETARGEAF